LAVGITGSHYRQTTADQGLADNLAKVYSEASTIGPVAMYTPHLFDRDITISLKYLREFNVQGRADQEYLICRIFMAF